MPIKLLFRVFHEIQRFISFRCIYNYYLETIVWLYIKAINIYPTKSIFIFRYRISLILGIWYKLQQHVQDEIQTRLNFCLISVESKNSKNYSHVLCVYYLLHETILFHFSQHISSMIVNVNTIRIMSLLRDRILHKYHNARETFGKQSSINVEIEQLSYLRKLAKRRLLKFGTIQYLV